MTSFTPKDITGYRKTFPPVNPTSQVEYLDQQLRNIEKTLNTLLGVVNQLQGVYNRTVDAPTIKFAPTATAPATPVEGECYWDSTTKKLTCYDGTAWQAAW